MRYTVYHFDEDAVRDCIEDNGLRDEEEMFDPSCFQVIKDYGEVVLETEDCSEAEEKTGEYFGNGECSVWDSEANEWFN